MMLQYKLEFFSILFTTVPRANLLSKAESQSTFAKYQCWLGADCLFATYKRILKPEIIAYN